MTHEQNCVSRRTWVCAREWWGWWSLVIYQRIFSRRTLTLPPSLPIGIRAVIELSTSGFDSTTGFTKFVFVPPGSKPFTRIWERKVSYCNWETTFSITKRSGKSDLGLLVFSLILWLTICLPLYLSFFRPISMSAFCLFACRFVFMPFFCLPVCPSACSQINIFITLNSKTTGTIPANCILKRTWGSHVSQFAGHPSLLRDKTRNLLRKINPNFRLFDSFLCYPLKVEDNVGRTAYLSKNSCAKLTLKITSLKLKYSKHFQWEWRHALFSHSAYAIFNCMAWSCYKN